jgi:hypothetical protein
MGRDAFWWHRHPACARRHDNPFSVNDIHCGQDPQAGAVCNMLYRPAPSRHWSRRGSCRNTPDEPDLGKITNKWPRPKLPVKAVAQEEAKFRAKTFVAEHERWPSAA